MSGIYYDPKTGWFHHIGIITEEQLPEGSIAITAELFGQLMVGESEGKIIKPGKKGVPFLQEPPPPAPKTAEEVLALRMSAYREESDSLKNEAEFDALVAGADPDYTEWKAKVMEIKERFPLPLAD